MQENRAETKNIIPVIDLFAGPGGLGEGFNSFEYKKKKSFKVYLSVEKDKTAYKTLELRTLFNEIQERNLPPDCYYLYLSGKICRKKLFGIYSECTGKAKEIAWKAELGRVSRKKIDEKIVNAIRGEKIWVLIGGPPCQAYSLVGRSRMKNMEEFETDERHFLYKEYLRILSRYAPPFFIMENVKGLLSAKINGTNIIHKMLKDLRHPNKKKTTCYNIYSLVSYQKQEEDVSPKNYIIKAEKYGIPQARHRVILIGIRGDIQIIPGILKEEEKVSLHEVIGDMPPIRSGVSKQPDSYELWSDIITESINKEWFSKLEPELRNDINRIVRIIKHRKKKLSNNMSRGSEFRKANIYSKLKFRKRWFYDKNMKGVCNHTARSHMESDIYRYLFASVYAKIKKKNPRIKDFPEELLPNHKNVKKAIKGDMFSDRFRVQTRTNPATTITSHISKDGHYYIHYDPLQCRSLTVREAARVQTFPDNYYFEGKRTQQYHQVGNAVPPLLANKIAGIVFEIISKMPEK